MIGSQDDFVWSGVWMWSYCRIPPSPATGLAMNQIELEKIADTFDKDRSGMIDLSEIISVLKGSNRRTRRPVVQEAMTDAQRIDNEVPFNA